MSDTCATTKSEYHAAISEALLLSCQLPASVGETPPVYPQSEDGMNTISNALLAALVHATLSNAAALREWAMARINESQQDSGTGE